jgi:asparagine synthase (glutamine-hydrolysing)
MCGIFCYLGLANTDKADHAALANPDIYNGFMQTRHRGPDNSHILIDDNLFIGFHRLMINDLTYNGDQPMIQNENVLICNGEIYNFKELIKKYKLNCKSHSDCEVIVQLYNYFKTIYHDTDNVVRYLSQELDGEFAFIIYDKNIKKLIVVRDRFGMRPLFIGTSINAIGFGSELKNLDKLFDNVEQFKPSNFAIYNTLNNKLDIQDIYYEIPFNFDRGINLGLDVIPQIRKTFEDAVQKRLISDVPICALLSGGLDSSLVCGILTEKLGRGVLNTFSIGMKGSTDLHYARKVADYIGSIHHEVLVSEKEMLESIEEVIRITETYDITSVRASTPHYLVSKYIKENTNFRCVLSGEMSDELLGGYLYFKKAPDSGSFIAETHRLLNDICYFDNLRADRCISSQSLEARVPFSDTKFISLIQSIDPVLRQNEKIEKYLLRKAFDGANIIPDEVLWRSKSAFSDAVSSDEKSWYRIIQDHVDTLITDDEFEIESIKYGYCTPTTKESYYYRKTFHKYYKNNKVIPYFWLPKFIRSSSSGQIIDPSARTLTELYKNEIIV